MIQLAPFFADRRGASSLLFGLLALPLMGTVGAMSDYTTAATARTKFQSTVDSVALKMAREVAGLDANAIQSQGDALVRSVLAGRGDLSITNVSVTRNGNFLDVTGWGSAKARFATMLGGSNTPVRVHAQVRWQVRKVEVALVIENSGMGNGHQRIANLKPALGAFIDTLAAGMGADSALKVSLVPFDQTVNLGKGYKNANWLRFDQLPNGQKNNWQGCLNDRDQPYDTSDAPPIPGTIATLYPAQQCIAGNIVEMMPLNDDLDAVKARIDTMFKSGSTNIALGVVWGLATLSPELPMSGGVPFNDPEVEKIMVLVVYNGNSENRFTKNSPEIDSRSEIACQNTKDKGVTVYTIRYMSGNEPLLKTCASASRNYQNVETEEAIGPALQRIAQLIQNIRLTH
jgi:Flp pilus assembly protein TadG